MTVALLSTAADVRAAARTGAFREPTTGHCPDNVQANLIVLPAKYADDFRRLCSRNPVACPLLAESTTPGQFGFPAGVADGIDIRTDVPGYNVYEDGKLVSADIEHICDHWAADSVAFLIGCSFTFEAVLDTHGLTPRHTAAGRNVPMYRTDIKLMPSGVFGGNMVVSMRPYRPEDVERVRALTRPYIRAHGEPVAWGWDGAKALGIDNVHAADFGDDPVFADGEIPVFWACGVTPQLAVMGSPDVKGVVLGHTPGKMVCLDMHVGDVLG